MADEAKIRWAQLADYEGMVGLFDHLDALHRQRLPWMFREPQEPPRSREFFQELLKDEDVALLIAEAGGVVGVAMVLMRDAPDFPVFVPQRWGVVDNLVVSPEWRRRGVGQRLMGAAEKWVRKRGGCWVELAVYEFNTPARAFYERAGYLPLTTKFRKPMAEG